MDEDGDDDMIDSMRMIIKFKNDRIAELERDLAACRSQHRSLFLDYIELGKECERLKMLLQGTA